MRTGYNVCGYPDAGQPLSLTAAVGSRIPWFWPFPRLSVDKLEAGGEPFPHTGELSPRPFSMSNWAFYRFFRRVKKISVNGHIEIEETIASDGGPPIYVTYAVHVDLSLPWTEQGLVVDGSFSATVTSDGTSDITADEPLPLPFTITIAIDFRNTLVSSESSALDFDFSILARHPTLTANVAIGGKGGLFAVSGIDGAEVPVTFTLLGDDSGLERLFWQPQSSFTTMPNTVVRASLVVTAKEFHEYAKGDGTDPIYDSSTGERLIDPVPLDLG